MNQNILLVEPAYKNKYPPLGLMKLSTYHKGRGDNVSFVKGLVPEAKDRIWDRVYVTTLFTFHFDLTVKTIRYYKSSVGSTKDIFVGGILASLMPEKVKDSTGVTQIVTGQLSTDRILGYRRNINIDELVPDYDILDTISYKYPAGDNYFAYTTRGCPNHCPFCAVPKLEPVFKTTNRIKEQISIINREYGEKRNLLLLDNNVLYSDCLQQIVDDIYDCGFQNHPTFLIPNIYDIYVKKLKSDRDNLHYLKKVTLWLTELHGRIAKKQDKMNLGVICEILKNNLTYETLIGLDKQITHIIDRNSDRIKKQRYVDFNQGIDARLLTEDRIRVLTKLPIRPLRIAYDNINDTDVYIKAVKLSSEHGIKSFSNYMLYNFKDRPEDLWIRLQVNLRLREELGISIFSFPMKYIPIEYTNRDYLGEYWNKKYIRAIQAVLLVKNGIVSSNRSFVERAFGKTEKEFQEILLMPENYIINRSHNELNGMTSQWRYEYSELSDSDRDDLISILGKQDKSMDVSPRVSSILKHYE